MENQCQESAAGSCEEEEAIAAAVMTAEVFGNIRSFPGTPGTPRPRTETSDAYFTNFRGPSRRRVETVLGLEDWRVDPSNPFVGCFRHAPHALPPSRHIHVPDGQEYRSTSEDDPFLTGVRWKRAISE